MLTDRKIGLLKSMVLLALASCGEASTYSISGQVTGLSGVTLTLSGNASKTTISGEDGTFKFTGLSDGSYQVTPTLARYTFSPQLREVTLSGADVTGLDFAVTYSISGSAGLVGVTLTLSGETIQTTTTQSEEDGAYQFSGLSDGSYLVRPTLSGYTFDPRWVTVEVEGANVTGQDFTPATVATYRISGSAGVAGVTLTVSGDSTEGATSADGGAWEIAGLRDGSYKVTPSKAGYYFSPYERNVIVSGTDVTGVDFVAIPKVSAPFTISGVVSGTSGGVQVTLSGDANATTTTDVHIFAYSFGVDNGSYRVTPVSDTYTFNPEYRDVTVSGASVSGQSFTATSITFSISGSAGVAGATITLSGPTSKTTTSAEGGAWEITGLTRGSYTVTPTLTGYVFDPLNRSVTVDDQDVSGQDFTATSGSTYTISGIVSGVGSRSIQIILSGDANATTNSDSHSNTYSFIVGNGSYRLTPTSNDYTFNPAYLDVTVSGANKFGQNFTGTAIPYYSISGTVGIGGVLLALSGDANATTFVDPRDSSHSYSFGVRNGSYRITPTLTGYTFSPEYIEVTISGANMPGENFTPISN
jgi:hypothetical protein